MRVTKESEIFHTVILETVVVAKCGEPRSETFVFAEVLLFNRVPTKRQATRLNL